MKITEDLRRVAEQFGRQYNLKEGDLGKNFGIL